jgi:hypothetical protein
VRASHPSRFAFIPLGVWLLVFTILAAWTTRQDHRIAENPHWVLVSSWWEVVTGGGTIRMTDKFSAADADFDPVGLRQGSYRYDCRQVAKRSAKGCRATSPNVIVVVLESIAAR